MKQLLLPVKTSPWVLTALLIAMTITGCSTMENSKTESALDLPHSESSSPANMLLDNEPEENGQSTIPGDQFVQMVDSSANAEPANREPEFYQIDLPTALRLASVQNYKIAVAMEKIAEASAQVDQSKVLLLPTVTVGASYDHHEGEIQETNGNVLNVNRSSRYAGLGSGAAGAGTIQIPGVSLIVDLGDAFFEPLVAKQNALAAKAGARAGTNQVLLDVTTSYYQLVHAKAALAITEETLQNASYLAKLTESFAKIGEGLESDAERAAVEELLRERELQKAREVFQVQSIRLAELLHLDAKIQLDPSDKDVVPIHIVQADRSLSDLIDAALLNHPEVKQRKALVDRDFERFRQIKHGPLIPKLALNFSAGNFGDESSHSGGRSDYAAMIYWKFTFGDKAHTREQRSVYQQARLERLGAVDRIASEVAQAYAHVESLKKQISSSTSAVERALSSLQLNRTRIYEKQGLPIEVLQAIQSLEITRRLYLDTVIDYNQAQFRLYTALGQPPRQSPRHGK
ncbi:MAG: TolC family protein [Planctomycetes bacterium]|nr:TolC family protein [Planctomycetota bacterium]